MIKKQIEIINQLQLIASCSDEIAILWLYGSRAKGTEHQDSDFDLAVAFNAFDLSTQDKYLRPNLLKLDLALTLGLPEEKISVVDINQVPSYLAFNIVETGQILFKDDSKRYYQECNRIWSQLSYLDKENQREQG